MATEPLRALALICTLSRSPEPSSTELLATQVLDALAAHHVAVEQVRVVDHNVAPGIDLDMGEGDDWPSIRAKVIDADVVILATPTWLGQPSSVCQRVLERLDAELSEHDDEGRPLTYGKVGAAVVVGNEDGAHHISAILFQALNDVGFSLPAGAVVYWNGEALHKTDYKDLESTPESVASMTSTLASNASHLARLLREQPFPPS